MEGDDEENEEEGEFGYCDFCGDETFNGTKLDSGVRRHFAGSINVT